MRPAGRCVNRFDRRDRYRRRGRPRTLARPLPGAAVTAPADPAPPARLPRPPPRGGPPPPARPPPGAAVPPPADPAPPARLYSLDALRGFDMFWIMGGEELAQALARWWTGTDRNLVHDQLEHVAWNG